MSVAAASFFDEHESRTSAAEHCTMVRRDQAPAPDDALQYTDSPAARYSNNLPSVREHRRRLSVSKAAYPTAEHGGFLPIGGSLLGVTDGLGERRHESIDAGFERLVRAAAAAATQPRRIVRPACARSQSHNDVDDIALMAIRRAY
jgi:hypothetical protein